jgi:hypothetical protein
MKKNTYLSTILLFTSIIHLSGQSSDSVKCYTEPELRKITTVITQGAECQELLDISTKKIELQDSIIANYNEQIANYKMIVPVKDTVSVFQEQRIQTLKDELKSTKKYWLYSSVGLFTLIVLLIL